MGLSETDLDELTLGMVYDMLTERANDHAEDAYSEMATQEDFDRF